MKYRRLIICLCILVNSNRIFANQIFQNLEVTQINSDSIPILLTNNIYIFYDTTKSLQFEGIKNKDFIHINNKSILNLGITKSNIWLKILIHNNTSLNEFYLLVAQSVIDSITLFQSNGDGNYTAHTSGEYIPFSKRFSISPNYIFPINIETGKETVLYLKIISSDQIQLPIYIGSPKTILEGNANENLYFGLYIGIIFIMILYNFFIYLSSKDSAYLLYIFYIAFVGLTQATLRGYAFKYLWPNLPEFTQSSTLIIPMISGVTTGFFMKYFLSTKKMSPKLNSGINIFILSYLVIGGIGVIFSKQLGVILMQSIAFIGSLYALLVGIIIARKGYRPAYFFLIAYTIFLIAILIFVLRNFNLLPYNNFTSYILEIGSVIQILLLSFALADKINTYRKEQNIARQQALTISKENERLVKEQNIILEQEVKNRTTELEKTNNELSHTLHTLKSTQTQLVDSEKMASLGQLTAGIAHEINNPINFVTSNVKPLQLDINDVFSVIKKYEEINVDQNIQQQLKDVTDYKKQIDIDYVKAEINTLLLGIKEGAERTANIVSSLKNFARVDQSNMKRVNLNEGLESTLILVRNTFPKNMILEKKLGEIPDVECVPGKINQVFMNLITNAVHAIKVRKYDNQNTGVLTITSWHENNLVKVSVKDNGMGMPEEVKQKIFEPFFTTKEIGEGTGLGMSIVLGIIENHKGKINIISEVNVGTEIIVTLITKQPEQ